MRERKEFLNRFNLNHKGTRYVLLIMLDIKATIIKCKCVLF